MLAGRQRQPPFRLLGDLFQHQPGELLRGRVVRDAEDMKIHAEVGLEPPGELVYEDGARLERQRVIPAVAPVAGGDGEDQVRHLPGGSRAEHFGQGGEVAAQNAVQVLFLVARVDDLPSGQEEIGHRLISGESRAGRVAESRSLGKAFFGRRGRTSFHPKDASPNERFSTTRPPPDLLRAGDSKLIVQRVAGVLLQGNLGVLGRHAASWKRPRHGRESNRCGPAR